MTDGPDCALDFDPDRPIDWAPHWHRDITLVPWGADSDQGARRSAGLFDTGGAFLPEGHCYRYATQPITTEPARPPFCEPSEHLAGRWLYGGLCYGHFGHFLCETTSRLWALDLLKPIDGIVFLPKKQLTHERRQFRHHLPFLAAIEPIAGRAQIRAPQSPVSIEQLAIPPQGFGIGGMIAGRPEFRAFMRTRLREAALHDMPQGVPDIYVSRSGLASQRGRVVMEQALEALLEREGYQIFHPQDHSVEEQIARYQTARRIVALDGSALHLTAMVADPQTRVAIINRGPSVNIDDYILQFRRFAGIEATRIDAIVGCWSAKGRRFVKREAQARLDFCATGQALAREGFIRPGTVWADPPEARIEEELSRLVSRQGTPLVYRDLR